ncbi:hypothetical protein Y1Q_0010662 [Alligator mississippiensis]|uniref:Uncharacterized protein n=1 Tax=Alligator mississippiensis TaxID=8496 RepID=A0A151M6C7_ALLMI|nr:hypothetical protein Y1Q_0010662 [Alligator mississippiensis]
MPSGLHQRWLHTEGADMGLKLSKQSNECCWLQAVLEEPNQSSLLESLLLHCNAPCEGIQLQSVVNVPACTTGHRTVHPHRHKAGLATGLDMATTALTRAAGRREAGLGLTLEFPWLVMSGVL